MRPSSMEMSALGEPSMTRVAPRTTISAMASVQPFQESHPGFERRSDIFGQYRFIRMMADAARAAEKQHGGRHAARHNHRVMTRTAGHSIGRWEETHQARIHGNRRLVEPR